MTSLLSFLASLIFYTLALLSLHSVTFANMFNLPSIPSSADVGDEVTMQDDPLKFVSLLNALYKGM